MVLASFRPLSGMGVSNYTSATESTEVVACFRPLSGMGVSNRGKTTLLKKLGLFPSPFGDGCFKSRYGVQNRAGS